MLDALKKFIKRMFSCLIVWWTWDSEKAEVRVLTTGRQSGSGQARVWNAEDRVWANTGSEWTDR